MYPGLFYALLLFILYAMIQDFFLGVVTAQNRPDGPSIVDNVHEWVQSGLVLAAWPLIYEGMSGPWMSGFSSIYQSVS